MEGEKTSLKLKGVIDPEHLLQAIRNSLEHSHETAHGVTCWLSNATQSPSEGEPVSPGPSSAASGKKTQTSPSSQQNDRDHHAEHNKESHSSRRCREDWCKASCG